MKIRLRILQLTLLALLPFTALAQCPVAAPVIFCVDASVPGVTKVHYAKPTGSNVSLPPAPAQEGFDYYELQHSLAPTGPFDSVNFDTDINTLELTHNNADHSKINYYKIISHSLCGGAPPFGKQELSSNVFNTILIQSTVTNDTLIGLTWNNNGLGNPGNNYNLWREAPLSSGGGLGFFTGNIPFANPAYGDTLHECNDKAIYQVRIDGPAGSNCESISPPDTVDIVDNTPPSLQLVDSVSFNSFLNKPMIGWKPNQQKDIEFYVIISCTPSGYNPIDTVPANKLSFIDTNYTNTGSVGYSVYAVDLCGNASTSFAIDCHKTMYLTYDIDVCNETVELIWNAYDDFNSGVDVVYNVYVSQGGAPPTIIGTTKSTTFLHEDPITNTSLTYFVRAVEKDGAGPKTAISNLINLSTEFLKAPEFSYLRKVTVSDKNQVRMEMYTDVKADVNEYRIKRATDTKLSSFITIGTIRRPDIAVPSDSIVGYNDNTATTDLSRYFYLIESLDSCGRILDTSNYASSIRLRVEVDNDARINKLIWNNYIGWAGKIFGYRVFRGQDGVMDTDPLVTVFPIAGEESFYEDDVNGLTEGAEGEFCYYIQAIEDEPTFPRLEPATSLSNIACIKQQPLMHIPNAFTPEGLNPIFKPVIIFSDLDNYQFTIFSRNGEILYETTNINAGWDGKVDGKLLPSGVYVYMLKYRSISGQKFQKRGTLRLIR